MHYFFQQNVHFQTPLIPEKAEQINFPTIFLTYTPENSNKIHYFICSFYKYRNKTAQTMNKIWVMFC